VRLQIDYSWGRKHKSTYISPRAAFNVSPLHLVQLWYASSQRSIVSRLVAHIWEKVHLFMLLMKNKQYGDTQKSTLCFYKNVKLFLPTHFSDSESLLFIKSQIFIKKSRAASVCCIWPTALRHLGLDRHLHFSAVTWKYTQMFSSVCHVCGLSLYK